MKTQLNSRFRKKMVPASDSSAGTKRISRRFKNPDSPHINPGGGNGNPHGDPRNQGTIVWLKIEPTGNFGHGFVRDSGGVEVYFYHNDFKVKFPDVKNGDILTYVLKTENNCLGGPVTIAKDFEKVLP